MRSYLKIPLTLSKKDREEDYAFELVSIESSIKQYIDLMVSSRQGECVYNPDFGYSLWTKEFEPILNVMEWQPVLMEQIKEMLEKYEHRITAVQVWEPTIETLMRTDTRNKGSKTSKNYKITIRLDYTIKQSGERQNDVQISFEY